RVTVPAFTMWLTFISAPLIILLHTPRITSLSTSPRRMRWKWTAGRGCGDGDGRQVEGSSAQHLAENQRHLLRWVRILRGVATKKEVSHRRDLLVRQTQGLLRAGNDVLGEIRTSGESQAVQASVLQVEGNQEMTYYKPEITYLAEENDRLASEKEDALVALEEVDKHLEEAMDALADIQRFFKETDAKIDELFGRLP
ncbi:MAG: hypothetical protein IKB96_04390, partial [Prevotella sp.]|nr:hypothetical protein [Prevotella sp.]